ncbi:MAG: hypothetical protein ACJ78Q_10510 [Chloroflexia bacterium]
MYGLLTRPRVGGVWREEAARAGLVRGLALALAVAIGIGVWLLSWQSASAHDSRQAGQGQPATFTLSPTEGNCKPVTGYGAHFPSGRTVFVDGPFDPAKGTSVAPAGEEVHLETGVAPDGTFKVVFNPCPRRVVFPNAFPGRSFPVGDHDKFMFSAENPEQELDGRWALAYYMVSGLGNAGLPGTGAATPASGGSLFQASPFTVMLLASAMLIALGVCLSLFARVRHRGP